MKNGILSKSEKKILLEFLSDLSDRFGNAGCNDYTLPNNPDNQLLMTRVIEHCFSSNEDDRKQQLEWLNESKKTILTMDVLVLQYIENCVKQLPTHD